MSRNKSLSRVVSKAKYLWETESEQVMPKKGKMNLKSLRKVSRSIFDRSLKIENYT